MMSYYKVRIEVWCDWDPGESDLEEIAENIGAGEAIMAGFPKSQPTEISGREQILSSLWPPC